MVESSEPTFTFYIYHNIKGLKELGVEKEKKRNRGKNYFTSIKLTHI